MESCFTRPRGRQSYVNVFEITVRSDIVPPDPRRMKFRGRALSQGGVDDGLGFGL